MIHRNFKLKNRNQIKEVLKKINVDNHQLVEKGYSSYSTVLDYEKFGVFDKIIEKFLKLAGKNFNIVDFWINIYFKNGYVKKHNHTTSIKKLEKVPLKTGVYYFEKPRNSGNIVVNNRLIKVRQEDMIIFEGKNIHYSEKNLSVFPRIIFSVNMMKGVQKIWNEKLQQYNLEITKNEL